MEKSCKPKEMRPVAPSPIQEPEVIAYEKQCEREVPGDTSRRASLRSSLDEPEVSYHEESYSDLDGPFY